MLPGVEPRPVGFSHPRGHSRSYGRGMTTLLETVFAGMETRTFSNGNTFVTPQGITHSINLSASGSACAITASGLQLTGGTSGESFASSIAGSTLLALSAGSQADGIARWRRGSWAYWWKMPVISLTNTWYSYTGVVSTYPQHGYNMFRCRNSNGTQNTTVGGVSYSTWWNGADRTGLIVNSAIDTFCLYFRNPYDVDYYYGSWGANNDWPKFEDLTIGAWARPYYASNVYVGTSGFRDVSAFYNPVCCGNNNAVGIIERYRYTTWD